MKKEKTLLKKYLRTTMVVILIGFVILGTSLWMFISRYWENEKKELLMQNATSISNFINHNNIEFNDEFLIKNPEFIQSLVNAFSANINAGIFISDNEGNLLWNSEYLKSEMTSQTIDKDTVTGMFKSGGFSGFSNMGGLYGGNYYVVGVPIVNSAGENVAMTFAATAANTLYKYRFEVFSIFLLSGLIILILYFICAAMMFYKMVKPLKQMAQAAELYAKGDFSKRIVVNSDDEIGRLSHAFNNMANSISALEGVRRNFIANVSHELKTPMTTISGFVDGILDGTIEKSDREHYLKIVSSETKRLSRLVKSMLNLSRIDSGNFRLSITNFDLFSMVLNVLISFEKEISNKSIKIKGLEKSSNIFIDADEDMIYQAVYNLIENAVKFTKNGGYMIISVFEEKERAVFSIENSCAPMSDEDLNHIFDRFYKTDKSRSKDKNGLGLGLHIVKKIIKSHKGDVTAENKGESCKFKFYIPFIKKDNFKDRN